MSLSLSELQKLHNNGFALMYLRPKSKRPIEDKWTTGKRKRWDEIEQSFERSNNVGVRTGLASHIGTRGYLCCVDVDVESPAYKKKALAALKELTGDTYFPTVISGSGNGSRHLYCVTREPFKQIEVVKEKGKFSITLYSEGRQMVLPPSIHPDTGFKYAWLKPFKASQLPLLNPEQYKNNDADRGMTSLEASELKFKAVDVNLDRIHFDILGMIRIGKGCDDRSAALMTIAMHMCRMRYTDNEILSVLSDEANWISSAAYDRRKGRRSAVEWLYNHTLLKARYETSVMRLFDNPPDSEELAPMGPKRVAKEKARFDEEFPEQLERQKDGKPKVLLKNVMLILEQELDGDMVAFNEFTNRTVFLKDTVYGGKKGKEVTDHDDLQLMHWISRHHGFEPSQDFCFKAHALIAKRHKFHPVRKYLENLEWDGVGRLDSWLANTFSAIAPREYLRAISRKTLVAAVKRVMEPGCKFDHVLVLEGNQGEGKSMSLSILATPEYFTDGLGDIYNKDVVDQMTGKWVIELSELASIRGRESEHVKAFISRQVDRVRMSYGRRSEDYPRQSIFIGSTNSSEYFTDETGNRRYWPARVGKADIEWLKKNRDQLWAEAVVRYELGENLYLTDEVEAIARKEQEKRYEMDEWEVEIKKIVAKTEKPYITTELWRSINLTSGNGHPADHDCKRISKIMRRLGFSKTSRRIDGEVCRCWV